MRRGQGWFPRGRREAAPGLSGFCWFPATSVLLGLWDITISASILCVPIPPFTGTPLPTVPLLQYNLILRIYGNNPVSK